MAGRLSVWRISTKYVLQVTELVSILELNLKVPDRILIQTQGIVQMFNRLTILILHLVVVAALTVFDETIVVL